MTLPYDALMPLAPWERPEVLQEAIDGLLGQTLTAARLVVSADGPPPAALRQVLEQACLPLTLIVGPGGEGVGPVLARGLLACREDLVVRIDADDLSLPDRCRIQVESMGARPELVALSGPILEFIDDPAHPCGVRWVPASGTSIQMWSRWRNPLNHPATVLRRSAVLAMGSYRNCPGFEDYDLWLRVLKFKGASALANLPQSLVLAKVGSDHLERRRGINYLRAETRFLLCTGRDCLLPWPRVILLLFLRLPIRLLPPQQLTFLMKCVRRKNG